MTRIMLFELKKMLGRRVALAVNVGVLVALVGIMALNVFQNRGADEYGNTLVGLEDIAFQREVKNAHAGEVTAERVVADLAAYRALAFERVDPSEVEGISDAAAIDLVRSRYDLETVFLIYDPYWSFILSPWSVPGEEPYQTAARVSDEEAARFYEAADALVQVDLDDGQGGSWEYSDAERAYWTDMRASVERPLTYGYVDGWKNVIDCAAFLSFAMLAVCVTLSPVFSAEYQGGTDAVLLSTRYGRSRLVGAKVCASLLYATAYFALAAAVIFGFSLGFYGAEGFGRSIQNVMFSCPYALSVGQAALVMVGCLYLATLGIAALTLLLSSRTRSSLAVFVAGMLIVFVTGMLPSGGSGVIARVLAVFPLGFSSFGQLFGSLTSYPLGPVVLDLVAVVVIAYLALALVSAPLAALSWRRHQVA